MFLYFFVFIPLIYLKPSLRLSLKFLCNASHPTVYLNGYFNDSVSLFLLFEILQLLNLVGSQPKIYPKHNKRYECYLPSFLFLNWEERYDVLSGVKSNVLITLLILLGMLTQFHILSIPGYHIFYGLTQYIK